MLARRAASTLLCLALAAGCAPGPRELQVGDHRVTVTPPAGFEVVALENSFLFRDGPVLLELTDLGAPGGDPGEDDPLDEWVAWGMRGQGFTVQWEIARTGTLHAQGRELRVVETRDRLTHGNPSRYAFAWNEGSLLMLRVRGAGSREAIAAFDQLLRTLVFEETGTLPRQLPAPDPQLSEEVPVSHLRSQRCQPR